MHSFISLFDLRSNISVADTTDIWHIQSQLTCISNLLYATKYSKCLGKCSKTSKNNCFCFRYSHQSISDYSWEVYIVHSGVFAGWAYMHEDRTCVGIFNLHRGWLSLHRGPPVNVPIRRTAHCIMSFLNVYLKGHLMHVHFLMKPKIMTFIYTHFSLSSKLFVALILAHLSRRLTSELIVYPCSVVVVVVVQTFQTSSPLKPLGQSKPNFMWSILRKGERKFI